jgi:uncharacterized protein (DUF1330 family)
MTDWADQKAQEIYDLQYGPNRAHWRLYVAEALRDERERCADEIERLQSNIEEITECLGVRYLYWDGSHEACLNQTNVPVRLFPSKEAAQKWVSETNIKNETEHRCQTGNHIDDEIERLKAECLKANLLINKMALHAPDYDWNGKEWVREQGD